MPYITEDKKSEIAIMGQSAVRSPGELNYFITTKVLNYIGNNSNYTLLNEVIGVLECVKLELYRRVAAPYEDTKIAENGDVY